MSDSPPISWRSIVYGTPVMSSDNQAEGTVREVLGSDSEDIFHGLRVSLSASKRDVMLAADDVAGFTADRVSADLTRAELEGLPTYEEHATYHLASVGWLRKHIGWSKDSKSDEEPG